jgi:hypothetical protein
MSVWERLAAWVAAAAKTPAGEAAAASTVGSDISAVAAGVKFVRDLAANKATVAEGLSAGLSLDKALAPLIGTQAEADVELAISLAEGLTALYQALPPGWQFIKNDPGLPYKGDGINPNSGAALGV